MLKQFHLIGLISWLALAASPSAAVESVMGYRTNARMPYISDGTGNGIYRDLYTTACKRVGCTLKIVRLPKERINRALHEGEVDFYPGYAFNLIREQSVFFFPNGLVERFAIVNPESAPPIKSFSDLIGQRELRSLGNPSYLPPDIQNQTQTYHVSELGIPRALHMLRLGRADFFIYDDVTLRFYWLTEETNGLRFNSPLEAERAMYTAWSKRSHLYQTLPNTAYRNGLPISPENHPQRLNPASIPGRLQAELARMQQSGETSLIVQRHLTPPRPGGAETSVVPSR
ncbi:MAG: transporter substrate-binding domain-containing protein [Zoogloeaceae bacterium]|nr:transporter substrate-binding domain-containing protein [Zoogloeaceae bacterium]